MVNIDKIVEIVIAGIVVSLILREILKEKNV